MIHYHVSYVVSSFIALVEYFNKSKLFSPSLLKLLTLVYSGLITCIFDIKHILVHLSRRWWMHMHAPTKVWKTSDIDHFFTTNAPSINYYYAPLRHLYPPLIRSSFADISCHLMTKTKQGPLIVNNGLAIVDARPRGEARTPNLKERQLSREVGRWLWQEVARMVRWQRGDEKADHHGDESTSMEDIGHESNKVTTVSTATE